MGSLNIRDCEALFLHEKRVLGKIVLLEFWIRFFQLKSYNSSINFISIDPEKRHLKKEFEIFQACIRASFSTELVVYTSQGGCKLMNQ